MVSVRAVCYAYRSSVLLFLFQYLNTLSAERIDQYKYFATDRTVHGSNSVTGKRTLLQVVYRVAGVGWGYFLEGETLNSHASSAELKNVWRYTSNPRTSLRGVYMEHEGGDTREQGS
jgi:hypothetical protein